MGIVGDAVVGNEPDEVLLFLHFELCSSDLGLRRRHMHLYGERGDSQDGGRKGEAIAPSHGGCDRLGVEPRGGEGQAI